MRGCFGGKIYSIIFTAQAEDGTPCCLLSWVDGTAADKVISAGFVSPEVVLRSIGEGLAQLHLVPVDAAAGLRSIEEGGGCDLRLHTSGEHLALFRASEHAQGHDFLPFYKRQVSLISPHLSVKFRAPPRWP